MNFPVGPQCRCYTDIQTRALVADCSNIGLVEIPQDLPNYTNWLLVSGNNISSLNVESPFYPFITKLVISGINLDNITNGFIDLFTNCGSGLSFLDISNNNLVTLPRNIVNISSLRNLRLTGNSFKCSCENIWIKDWLNNSDIIEDSININCTMTGTSGETIQMIDMNPRDMDCPLPELPTTTANLWKILGYIII